MFEKRVHRECQHSEGCVFKCINSVLFWEFHGGDLLYILPNIPSFTEIDFNFIYLLLRQKKKNHPSISLEFIEINEVLTHVFQCIISVYLICIL